MRSTSEGMQILGQLVSTRRENLGISQRGLAKSMGISASYLCDVERGYRGVSDASIMRLSDILGVNKDVLFYYSNRIPNDIRYCANDNTIKMAFNLFRQKDTQ